jgi:hypothetical protein
VPVFKQFFKSRARSNSVQSGISFHSDGLTSRWGPVQEVAVPRFWFRCTTTEEPLYPPGFNHNPTANEAYHLCFEGRLPHGTIVTPARAR